MAHRIDTPPDLARPDSRLVLFPFTRVELGGETHVADTIASAFVARGLPAFGLISYNLFVGEGRLLHFTQLTRIDTRPDIDVERAFTAEIEARVPGIEVFDVTATRPYRSTARLPDAQRPGCYTLTTVTLEDPCPDGQRTWADAVLDPADSTLPPPESGLIATHFYSTTDCTRVLKVAEWTTTEAHQRAAAEHDPKLSEVPEAPRATAITTDEYQFAFSLLPE